MIGYILALCISTLGRVFSVLLLARVIFSWMPGLAQRFNRIALWCMRLTEPIVYPCRILLQRLMPLNRLDFSPILALFAVYLICGILLMLIRFISILI